MAISDRTHAQRRKHLRLAAPMQSSPGAADLVADALDEISVRIEARRRFAEFLEAELRWLPASCRTAEQYRATVARLRGGAA